MEIFSNWKRSWNSKKIIKPFAIRLRKMKILHVFSINSIYLNCGMQLDGIKYSNNKITCVKIEIAGNLWMILISIFKDGLYALIGSWLICLESYLNLRWILWFLECRDSIRRVVSGTFDFWRVVHLLELEIILLLTYFQLDHLRLSTMGPPKLAAPNSYLPV